MNNGHPGGSNHYDVAILGAGISGTTLGTILARHKARVLLVDAGVHPRFAVGESTIPNTSLMLQLLAERYSVPELMDVATPDNILKKVGSTCGIKRNFGFVYQREGQTPENDECMQLGVSELARAPESHWFRQDIDAYMMHVAIRYGVDVRLRTHISEVEIDDQGVTLSSASGEQFTARYIVDAGGYQSPLAKKFSLRETPCRMQHFSRCLFTHMIDVRPYDECLPRNRCKLSVPWFEGTLHHVFERGWIWVIPFNNHRASTNPLCSVGLTLDPRLYPKRPGVSPDQEFRDFIQRFPTVADQFKNARTVREWVSTDRLQYSSRQTTGYRFSLVAHAAGNLDALFSRGLINTMEAINTLADRLLDALADDDFAVERFEYLERLQQSTFDYNDRLVNSAFISFSDFDLWNAWFRVWALGVVSTEVQLFWPLQKYRFFKDPGALAPFKSPAYPGLLFGHHKGFKELFEDAATTVESFEAGRVSAADATRRILAQLKQAEFTDTVFNTMESPLAHAIKDPFFRDLNVRPGPYLRWLLSSRMGRDEIRPG